MDMSKEEKTGKEATSVEQPPQISPEEWQTGMYFFNKFLKEIKISRRENVVHVDWIFEFPSVEIAKAFVSTSKAQLGAIVSSK